MAEKYNGWTNYETWCLKLWMDNEEPSYRDGQRMAQKAWDNAEAEAPLARAKRAECDLAHELQKLYEDAKEDLLDNNGLSSSLWSDLLGAALSEVNWHEIAEHMIEDVDKDEETEDEEDAEEAETE